MRFEIIDTFCGAGGTTTGFEQAEYAGKKIARVISCINHDKRAIESHSANHIRAKHFTEDIKNFNVTKFPKFSDKAITMLWASLECTNFSNAKGGKPRDADSRTLPNHLFRYIEHLNPDYIGIENVREFMSWGDLDENRKPVSRDKGRLFLKWINKVKNYGYDYDWKLINSADYGAYTSRTRLFIIFAKKGLPIKFPEPTHCRSGNDGMFKVPKWKAVKEVLDFDDEGISIFGRKKPLSEKTLERIYAGLKKFIPNNDNFIVKYIGNNSETGINNGKSTNEPLNTITTQNRLAVIKCAFLSKYFSTDRPETMNISVNSAAHTLKTKDNHSLIQPEFLVKYYKTGKNVASVEDIAPTLTTKDRIAVIKPVYFMDMQFSSGQRNKSIDEPAGGLTTIPKQNIIKVDQAFIMNRQFNNIGSSIDKPSPTLIATMGKRPQYLVITEYGELAIKINVTDSRATQAIKLFMAEHGIIDVKMRMLKVPELLKIQGFPENYILKGNQTEQKKFIGNSVVPIVAKKIIEALFETFNKHLKTKKAA